MAESLTSVIDAYRIILETVAPAAPVVQPLGPSLLGLVTAQDAAADRDAPAFDKALMDGYAVRAADLASGGVELSVIEEVLAGMVPTREVGPGQATRIMTGAPLPRGADAVMMIERTKPVDGGRVQIAETLAPWRNVMPRGQEMRTGDVVVAAGTRLRPEEIGLLAAVGQARVAVYPRPAVAVVPTGDEIVDVDQTPGPGQIRNSNEQMLLAQMARAGGEPRSLGIARDEGSHLRHMIGEGLRADILVLSGGVSAGKADLVPRIVAELGVEVLLHKVRMKPGKPMLFGRKTHPDRAPTYVFGLPGNPVSSLVCFELFVRPAIRQLMHLPPAPNWVQARLAEPYESRSDRPTYYPATFTEGSDGRVVQPIAWLGSADLRSLSRSNAFVLIEEGTHRFAAGTPMSVLLVD